MYNLDLSLIYYKLKNNEFYNKLFNLCKQQSYYNTIIYKYQFYYLKQSLNNINKLKQYLNHFEQYLIIKCNIYKKNKFNYFEYNPLILNRYYSKNKILNINFRKPYKIFLNYIINNYLNILYLS